MTVSLGFNTTAAFTGPGSQSVMNIGNYSSGSYGTSPLMLVITSGAALQPNGGSMSDTAQWGASSYQGNVFFNTRSTTTLNQGPPNFFAIHLATTDFYIQDESHGGYLNSGGSVIYSGDAWTTLVTIAAILKIDDTLTAGPQPTVNGTAFTSSPQGVMSLPVPLLGGFFPATGWSQNSVSGQIDGTLLFNANRLSSPWVIAYMLGHSSEPVNTPDFINGFTSWSLVGFRTFGGYFVGMALWVPPDPVHPDYSFNFTSVPSADWGTFWMVTQNIPTVLTRAGQAMVLS